MEEVVGEIDNAIKSRQQQATINREAAQLDNFLVFQTNNEPIFGVDTLTVNPSSQSSSIALAS